MIISYQEGSQTHDRSWSHITGYFFKDIWKHFQPKPAVFHVKSDRLLALVCWWFSSVMSGTKIIFLTTSASSLKAGQERIGDGESHKLERIHARNRLSKQSSSPSGPIRNSDVVTGAWRSKRYLRPSRDVPSNL